MVLTCGAIMTVTVGPSALAAGKKRRNVFFLFNLVCLYELQLIELSCLFHVCFYLMLQYV